MLANNSPPLGCTEDGLSGGFGVDAAGWRAGEGEEPGENLSAGAILASSEPMKKRTQLKHLDGAPDAKAMALSPIAGGTEPSFQAEAKGGDGAEVMSFK